MVVVRNGSVQYRGRDRCLRIEVKRCRGYGRSGLLEKGFIREQGHFQRFTRKAIDFAYKFSKASESDIKPDVQSFAKFSESIEAPRRIVGVFIPRNHGLLHFS